MALKNNWLIEAGKNANNEFYTRYEDIDLEIRNYVAYNPDVFRDKVILLPCDDYRYSQFTRYFLDHFDEFGIKRLLSVLYVYKPYASGFLFGFENVHGKIHIVEKGGKERLVDLKGNGDFRSVEIENLCRQSDMVITNPPFSLFTVFFDWLIKLNKKFIVVGNVSAISVPRIYDQFESLSVWFGDSITSHGRWFYVPDDYPMEALECGIENGRKRINVKGVRWFTNVDFGKKYHRLSLDTMENNLKNNRKLQRWLQRKYGIDKYPYYDDTNILEVPLTNAIPSDYTGLMGVPITFIDKWNPEQFELIGLDRKVKENPNPGKRFMINGSEIFVRVVIQKKN